VIASSQEAIDAGLNRLQTGTLTSSDIENHSQYNAKSVSLSGGYSVAGEGGATEGSPSTTNNGSNWSWQNFNTGAQGASAGYGSEKGKENSTTSSGISGGTVVITDQSGQQALTGKSAEEALAALNRDVLTGDDANGLAKAWDGQKLQQQVEAQAQIAAMFGQQASKAVGDYADKKAWDLWAQGNDEEAAKWEEGGAYRVAAHAVMGLLGGGVDGALGAGGAAAAAGKLNEITAGMPSGVRELVGAGLAAGIGSIGGGVGAASAFNEDANNRMLHPGEVTWIREHAAEFAAEQNISREEAVRILIVEAAAFVDKGVQDKLAQLGSDQDNTDAIEFLKRNLGAYGDVNAFSSADRLSTEKFAQELGSNTAAFVAVFNALAQTAGDKYDWHSELVAANKYFGDASASQWGAAKAQAIGPAIGVAAAVGQTLFAACVLSPVGCNSVLTGLAEAAAADSVGGHTLSVAVGAGTAAGAASKIDDALEVAASAKREAEALKATVAAEREAAALKAAVSAEKEAAALRAAEAVEKEAVSLNAVAAKPLVPPFDTGPMVRKVMEVRAELPSRLRRSGNVAVAEIDIPGLPQHMAAHSSVSVAGKGVVGEGSRNFVAETVRNKAGELVYRGTDTEYKILDNIADRLGGNVNASGTINILTEKYACTSCLSVVDQFKAKYPNITVNIFDNKDVMLRPTGKVP